MPEDKATVSFKGLRGAYRTPLREFWGRLEGFEVQQRSGTSQDGRAWTRKMVLFNFSELKVIVSTDPYVFPIAQVPVGYSEQEKSNWGVLALSAQRMLGDNAEVTDLVGKYQHWKITDGHPMWDMSKGVDADREAWEIMEVEGIAQAQEGILPLDVALTILDGKTEPEFYQEVFQDSRIRSDSDLQDAILKKTFITAVMAAGKVIKDGEGVYRKV